MITTTEYIVANNPEGALRIIEKYGVQKPANAEQMVYALNHIGKNIPESKKDFIEAHPDHKPFHNYYGQTYNAEGDPTGSPMPAVPASFYKQHEGVIMLAAAIVIAAFILKK